MDHHISRVSVCVDFREICLLQRSNQERKGKTRKSNSVTCNRPRFAIYILRARIHRKTLGETKRKAETKTSQLSLTASVSVKQQLECHDSKFLNFIK
uniref:Uncharacterized protein n=1 Tax=Rhizophora mucronata TaxID=61149 RepID=A0A2P2JTM2_RHIMU